MEWITGLWQNRLREDQGKWLILFTSNMLLNSNVVLLQVFLITSRMIILSTCDMLYSSVILWDVF